MSDSPADNLPTKEPSLVEKLHGETARIAWHELQRFFAQGSVLCVSDSLDLIQTAVHFAKDEAEELEHLLTSGDIAPPSDQQAKVWYELEADLWTVVVAPFVLVQERREVGAQNVSNQN